MELNIRDLTRILKGQLILGDPRTVVKEACVDSRMAEPGFLFFALKGERADGHAFAGVACKKGASVVVSQMNWFQSGSNGNASIVQVANPMESLQFLGQHLRNSFKGPVIGITGSNGKTTTKQMMAGIMSTKNIGLSTAGNYNSKIGLPLVLSRLMPEHQWMVLEMGASAPGDITSLADIAHPSIGIITSIGPAHLATFGSIKNIARTKWELMDSLPQEGCAIVPWGEPTLEPFVRAYKKRIVFFGEDSSCPVRSSAVETREKVKFLLHVGSKNTAVQLPVPGRVNVSNALAAAAAAWVLQIPIEQIVHGLETFEPPKMRMETVQHASGAVLINDAYNANPASMVQSIRSVVESYPTHKHVLVLGSMLELGEETEKFHFHLGAELGKFNLEKVFLCGSETKSVIEGVASAGESQAQKFTWYESLEELTVRLQRELKPNTVVLFKGSRGVQLEKVIQSLGGGSGVMERVN